MVWIEVHQSVRDHRKVLMIADDLEMPEPHVVGHLVFLWLWALDNAPDGLLPESLRMIERAASWTGAPGTFVAALLAAGLLTKEGDRLRIHDWDDYAGKLIDQRHANAERQRRHRERVKAVTDAIPTADVTVTSPLRNGATVPNPTVPNPTVPNHASASADATHAATDAPTDEAGTTERAADAPSAPDGARVDAALHSLGLEPDARSRQAMERVIAAYPTVDHEMEAPCCGDWLRRKRRPPGVATYRNWCKKAATEREVSSGTATRQSVDTSRRGPGGENGAASPGENGQLSEWEQRARRLHPEFYAAVEAEVSGVRMAT